MLLYRTIDIDPALNDQHHERTRRRHHLRKRGAVVERGIGDGTESLATIEQTISAQPHELAMPAHCNRGTRCSAIRDRFTHNAVDPRKLHAVHADLLRA